MRTWWFGSGIGDFVAFDSIFGVWWIWFGNVLGLSWFNFGFLVDTLEERNSRIVHTHTYIYTLNETKRNAFHIILKLISEHIQIHTHVRIST